MKRLVFLAGAALFLLTGCTYYLSEQSRARADHSVSYPSLMQDPDAYRGRFLMLGGTVLSLFEDSRGSVLEIEQHRLDKRNLPDEATTSQGRFLATVPQRLDKARYGDGTLVVLAGTVTGSEVRMVQGRQYRYPVVEIAELHDIVIEQETHWGAFGGI